MMRGVGDTMTPTGGAGDFGCRRPCRDAGADPRLARPAPARRRQRRLGVGGIQLLTLLWLRYISVAAIIHLRSTAAFLRTMRLDGVLLRQDPASGYPAAIGMS